MVEGGHSTARLRRGAGPRHLSAGATSLLSWEACGRDGGQERCFVLLSSWESLFLQAEGSSGVGSRMLRADRKRGCAGGSGSGLRGPLEAFPGLSSGLSPSTALPAALEWGLRAFTFPARKQRLREGRSFAWSHTACKWWSSWALGLLSDSQSGVLSRAHTHIHACTLSQPYEFAFLGYT